jgi:hypothetical protein
MMVEMAEIFHRHGPAYRAKYGSRMLPSHRKAMRDIERCRTPELGGHVYSCATCEETIYQYHSCRDRHCPKCQNGKAQQWLQKQQDHLPAARYFMLTFTLPVELRRMARSHQRLFYHLLFRTSADAAQKLGRDPRFVGGRMGMVSVLHTWGRNLAYHPHVHALVPGGGVAKDGTWLPSRANFLVPVKALSKIFRAKFRDALRHRAPEIFGTIPPQVWRTEWVVHSQPVGNGLRALKYLAPYIFRVAISNRRIVKLADGKVTFRYRRTDTGKLRLCKLPAGEFIRRFLQHVLPKGFVKVRYYGFLAPGSRSQLKALRQLLGPLAADDSAEFRVGSPTEPSTQPDSSLGTPVLCPACGRPMHRRRIRPGEQCPQGLSPL